MVFKMSLEIINDNDTIPTKRSFLKVLYNLCKVKKKNITFEQYAGIHLDGRKIAICEMVTDTVFLLNSSFTTNDTCIRVAIDEACEAFNKMMQDFGYKHKLEIYDPNTHQTNPLQQHPLFFFQLPSLNVVAMQFHYCSSKPPHKQTPSLRCTTFSLRLVNITHRLHCPYLLRWPTNSFN